MSSRPWHSQYTLISTVTQHLINIHVAFMIVHKWGCLSVCVILCRFQIQNEKWLAITECVHTCVKSLFFMTIFVVSIIEWSDCCVHAISHLPELGIGNSQIMYQLIIIAIYVHQLSIRSPISCSRSKGICNQQSFSKEQKLAFITGNVQGKWTRVIGI